LSNFIKNNIINKDILEISDPSAKIAKLSQNFLSWEIIEPNPENIKIKNVSFIKGFFEDNFEYKRKDIIIHSHLLEHIHDPINFFKKCYDILKEDGLMIFSIPNMDFLLESNYSPNNILHFEHSYFINHDVVKYLCNISGFKIIETFKYKNHSIFFKVKKVIEKNKIDIKMSIKDNFIFNFNSHLSNIDKINKIILESDKEVYLFGAHVSSQFYISNGLNVDKIICLLDNDKYKENKILYGTNLVIRNPSHINGKNCIIICSHIGVYYDEISSFLIKSNNSSDIEII
jgi:predicted SAM-dependent methyltransferase